MQLCRGEFNGLIRQCLGCAIFEIANDWVADVGQLSPDLMRTAGLQFNSQQTPLPRTKHRLFIIGNFLEKIGVIRTGNFCIVYCSFIFRFVFY